MIGKKEIFKMATLFVKHTVKDYGNWKRVYDEFATTRKQNGVTGASVYRSAESPKTLIVTHQFNDMKAAQAFADSDVLKSAMANAGVEGHPEIWFGEEIESTSS
jgi:quinol monooxygenase YgiN